MSERNIFAVCDLDVDYAYHFMEYLSKKKNIPFEVRVFTSAAGFREYVKEHPVELLLISEKAMNSEIREAKIGQILILSDGVVSKGYEEYPSIYKYQSSNLSNPFPPLSIYFCAVEARFVPGNWSTIFWKISTALSYCSSSR